ncbi:Uncharacterised protein [uncultured archaeon]|nr:Uncharacterised protein [uncultured archaeon]
MEIPIVEFSKMTDEQRARFIQFENMRGVAIPKGVGFAIAYNSSNGYYMGTVISLNGEAGYARRNKETVLIRTCETFLGTKPMRSESDLVINQNDLKI